MGGIKPTASQAGYKSFTVAPQFPSQVENNEVTVPTPYGTIKNKWENKKGSITLQLEVPFNTTAKLVLNQNERKSLLVNGKAYEGTKSSSSSGDEYVVLGSGKYEIKYSK